jgi:hypothetical protein
MKRFFVWSALLCLMFAVPACVSAKKNPQAYGKGKATIYIFGVSQMLTDSVVYITNINQVDSIDLERKTKFLPFRSEFSLQLKEYMEGQLALNHQTTCVFYASSRKKLSKKFYKIKKRYLDDPYKKIVMVDERYFTFKHPLDAVSGAASAEE